MKKIIVLFFLVVMSCKKEYPTSFTESANLEMLIGLDGTKITLREVLYKHKGKKILIDVWASWCKDCIVGFPDLVTLQKEFPDVAYVFLSTDFSKPAWKRAIKKYQLKGDHYNLPKGMNEGDFVEFINLSWIPTYMVIDEKGAIVVFNETKSTAKEIRRALAEL
ncbi:TlpA disulfide reductase family protein [Polaribacter sp.]|uniref:TlpA family protein disulfide reductase n=1 Tax=Polaribacter sp. TaxID=1920175 RepID=UPI0025EF41DF|nr:TlpA disulfide reductase family protein [Polaribacter sp.]